MVDLQNKTSLKVLYFTDNALPLIWAKFKEKLFSRQWQPWLNLSNYRLDYFKKILLNTAKDDIRFFSFSKQVILENNKILINIEFKYNRI